MAAPQSPESAGKISEALLETVESFLDTCPMLTGAEITFSEITPGEAETVRLMEVQIGDDRFLMVAKRIGC